MLKREYCEAIDALRLAYEDEGLQAIFPPSLASALCPLPPREGENGQLTAYTPEHAIAIIGAFKKAIRSLKSDSMPAFLAAFEQSSLFTAYESHPGDSSFLEASPVASKPVELERINNLPEGLIESHIGQYLSGKDKIAFASSSKRFFDLSRDIREEGKLKKLLQILEHVVRGEQKKTEQMLKKFPGLLTQRSDVMDYSDRTFKNVSPWECMLWAMDTRYMGQMMLNCIPEGPAGDEIRRECLAQYEAMQVDGGGIHYERPATYKPIVRLSGATNPGDISFSDIERLFDTPDALLFWSNQFYYANKADSTVTPIAPTPDLSPEEITAFDVLKTSLTGMEAYESRLPGGTLKEHQLINTLFREYPAFKPTHHCESHYDFGIIDALQTFVDRFDRDWEQREALWMNVVVKIQRLSPTNILQHYFDPDLPFYPTPDFMAVEFKRCGQFYMNSSVRSNLFSTRELDSGFGFQFGLIRGDCLLTWGSWGGGPVLRCALDDLSALRRLREVRAGDAKLLQDRLHQALVPAPVGGAGGLR